MSEREMQKVRCLVCDKQLDYEPGPNHTGNVYDGGFMLLSFHYGSSHDQCHGFSGRKTMILGIPVMPGEPEPPEPTPSQKLLACDEIEAFICDECFVKKSDRMKGYDIKVRRTRELQSG